MNEVRTFYDRLRAKLQGKTRTMLFIALGCFGITVFAVNSIDSPNVSSTRPTPIRSSVAEAAPSLPQIFVHIVGSVKSPGIYRLPSSSRVFDAVFAAGGLLADADQASANFARILSDGEQILILSTQSSGASGSTNGSFNSGSLGGSPLGAKINLNRADQTLLETLPGVGPTLSTRILDFRKLTGSFHSVKDLMKVSGIGVKLFAKLSNLVTV